MKLILKKIKYASRHNVCENEYRKGFEEDWLHRNGETVDVKSSST